MPQLPEEPQDLTPDERRLEIAAIVARGILRLRQQGSPPPNKDLDVSEPHRPPVSCG